jgi:hypothetical protein
MVNLGTSTLFDKMREMERHTCLRSESISSSFCLICARRYSRLLKGANEYSSSWGEDAEDDDARETARSSIIIGGMEKVEEEGDAKADDFVVA